MKRKRTIKLHLYLDRRGEAKLRKTKYRLDDGEIRVGLTLYVPEQFFRPTSLEADASLVLKDEDMPPMQVVATP